MKTSGMHEAIYEGIANQKRSQQDSIKPHSINEACRPTLEA